jgi:hypothetical protein
MGCTLTKLIDGSAEVSNFADVSQVDADAGIFVQGLGIVTPAQVAEFWRNVTPGTKFQLDTLERKRLTELVEWYPKRIQKLALEGRVTKVEDFEPPLTLTQDYKLKYLLENFNAFTQAKAASGE